MAAGVEREPTEGAVGVRQLAARGADGVDGDSDGRRSALGGLGRVP